jgi:cyanophycin synthetase
VPLEAIRNGLRSYTTSFYQSPGRLNLLELGGYRVIVDYCHNVAGMEELVDFVRRLVPSHTIAMLAIPGDRRDEDIRHFAAIAATAFDEVVIREDANPRGRERGEVAGLLRESLLANGLPEDRITVVLDEIKAANTAMDRARPDDLVVLLADKPEAVWEAVVERSTEQWHEVAMPRD